MITAELHCHTRFSKDSLMNLDRMLAVCKRKKIDRIAITDHNTIQGALQAKEIDPNRVVIGEEISTLEGELLAYFVQEEVTSGLSPEDTIENLHEQGAFISVAHPFDRYRFGHWKLESLERIVPLIDAIEIYNARCIHDADNRKAQWFAHKWGIAGTVGSDAHTIMEIGRTTLFLAEFDDGESLKRSLKTAVADNHHSPPWIHLTSRYATSVKNILKLISRGNTS